MAGKEREKAALVSLLRARDPHAPGQRAAPAPETQPRVKSSAAPARAPKGANAVPRCFSYIGFLCLVCCSEKSLQQPVAPLKALTRR